MTKFKRQLVPGSYLTAADMLQVLSQQQLTAAAAGTSVLLAAEPALAWLLDYCCVGTLVGESHIPIVTAGDSTQPSISLVVASEPALDISAAHRVAAASPATPDDASSAAAAGVSSTDGSLDRLAMEVAATAGINRASAQVQQQYQQHQQQVLNRKQRRARRTPGAAAAAVSNSSVREGSVAVAGIKPPPAATAAVSAELAACSRVPASATDACGTASTEDMPEVAANSAVAGLIQAADGSLAAAPGPSSQVLQHQQRKHAPCELLHLVQLDLPEAVFLVHVLHCCRIHINTAAAAADVELQNCRAGHPVLSQVANSQTQQQCNLQHSQQQPEGGQHSQQQMKHLMSLQELWQWCCDAAGDNLAFVSQYAAYHHFRSKGWLPRSGLLYGADYVLYQLHPEHAHSNYLVSVLIERRGAETTGTPALGWQELSDCGTRAQQVSAADVEQAAFKQPNYGGFRTGLSWLDAHILQRLARQVLKQLLLLYVVVPPGLLLAGPECLQQLTVREVLVQRWVPAEHRDDGKG